MKKLTFILILYFLVLFANAQILIGDKQQQKELKGTHYVKATLYPRMNGFYIVSIDNGSCNPKKTYIIDQNGKYKEFQSEVAVLNFFFENGWLPFQTGDEKKGMAIVKFIIFEINTTNK
jgi:hypothetical protein